MDKNEFKQFFLDMKPMKYYEPASLELPRAQDMLNNKNNDYMCMVKNDGEWAMVIITEDDVHIKSRSISKKTGTYGEKHQSVPHIVKELIEQYPPGTVLLGELAFNDITKTSKDVGSILRCLPPKAIARQKDTPLYFYIFDVLAYDYEMLYEKPFEERFTPPHYLPKDAYEMITTDVEYIQITKHTKSQDFMEFADEVLSKGGEGAIVIKKDVPYAPGKRTAWDSLKVKKKLENLELPVISFLEPNKLYEGSSLSTWRFFECEHWGEITLLDIEVDGIDKKNESNCLTPVTKPYFYGWKNGVLVNHKGKEIRVASGLTDKDREWLSTNEAKELLEQGKLTATITGMEITADNSIRHPVFIKVNIN